MSDAKGNGPPADIAASELWVALQAMPKPHKVVDFPAKLPNSDESVGQVAIVPLSMEDVMVCKAQAAEQAKKMTARVPMAKGDEPLAYESAFVDEASVQILWKALRVPGGDLKKPVFPSPNEVRRNLLPDTIAVLMQMYNRTASECGPIVAYMSEEEMNAWIARLVEGGERFPLDYLSSAQKEDVLMHMASLLKRSPTVSGSVGSPPESGSPNSAESSDVEESAPVDVIDVPTLDPIG